MLKPRKSKWFEQLFAVYNRNLLRRRFERFRLKGIENLTADPGKSRIIYANHSTWWDGLIAFEVSRQAGLDAYVLMEERQLTRYRLFRRLGAFSIDRSQARSAYKSLEFAADLLNGSGAPAIWIFPQGEIRPVGAKPLGFEGGISKLAESSPDSLLVPLAIRCVFTDKFKPEIFAEAGRPISTKGEDIGNRKAFTALLENNLESLIYGIEAGISSGSGEGFADVI